jgi:hypothetical protein
VFIVKVERYIKFGLFTTLHAINRLIPTEHTVESNLDLVIKYFRFIQVVEHFQCTIIVKFLNVLCFGLTHLTSWNNLPKFLHILNFRLSEFMFKTAVLR